MRHQKAVWIVAILALLGGYAAGAWPVRAQADPFPFRVGDVVLFAVQEHGGRNCRIEDIRGTFALCGSTSSRPSVSIGRPEPPEEWINVAEVAWVRKAREEK